MKVIDASITFAKDSPGGKRNLVINISAQQKTQSRAMNK